METHAPDWMLYSFLTSQDYISTTKTSSYYPLAFKDTTSHDIRTRASLKNHKEAERRRRERINSHFNNLRTLLPSPSKTDKATLLAKVIQRVKELKQQTLEISETLPSETDEINVHDFFNVSNNDGRIIFKVSICCDDRSDLLEDLVEILKSLKMELLRAEISTIAGRIRNVLIVAVEEENGVESVQFLENALKSLVDRSSKSLMKRVFSGERLKRCRDICKA